MCRTPTLIILLLLLAGCNEKKGGDLPQTYPVKGKVLDTKGNPLKGGTVQFDTGKLVDMSVMGMIEPDGIFTIKTFRDKAESVGAPEGDYQVTVLPPLGDGNAPPQPIIAFKRFQVEAKDNTCDIDLRKK
jgi:hypothetical protein